MDNDPTKKLRGPIALMCIGMLLILMLFAGVEDAPHMENTCPAHNAYPQPSQM